MASGSISSLVRQVTLALVIVGITTLIVGGPTALADEHDENYWPDSNKPRAGTQVRTSVESRPDGVYVQIEVRQTSPGIHRSAERPGSAPAAAGPRSPVGASSSAATVPSTSSGSAAASASAAARGRTWTDATGIHHESADGDRITLTPPMISSATRDSWVRQLQQHPNEDPYLLYTNDQFGGLVWLPRGTSPASIRFGAPPAAGPPPVAVPAVPAGGGIAIDPREVALDALSRVPLPNIQLRMNPSLGLVALPGWFWVEGYDGRPFGTSRTVAIPPAVGAEVPVDLVPADDPRRRGSSVTVDVRVWAAKYEWSFGDGASLVTRSLGRPYPQESDIQHTYEYSSLRFPGGFPVRLTVEYAAEYRVNGGPPQPLPPIRRTYEAGYQVQEVQPVLTGR